jgi:WD repeat-containing protein 55
LKFNHHTDSVRAVDFSDDGNYIYTASKDQSFAVITNGVVAGQVHEAHDAPIHALMHIENSNIIATGDDDGIIKIWDLREANKGKKHAIVMELAEHEGTISQMTYNHECQQLLAASCDGMLGVFDLRTKKLYAMSDNFEEDLTSVCLLKNDKKVITSTSEGILNLFTYDFFGDCNDRITGHPGAIDTMIKYDEDIVITGCEDGQIRAVSVLPNEIVAILGEPNDPGEEVFHI